MENKQCTHETIQDYLDRMYMTKDDTVKTKHLHITEICFYGTGVFILC